MIELLKDFPVIIESPVAWGEMDAFQHVNNIVYFRYFESARIAYFNEIKVMEVMNETNLGPILASTYCSFKVPLTYPDTVSIGSKIIDLRDEKFTMKYSVVSHKLQRVAAEGEGLIVYFDYRTNKKASIPEIVKKSILAKENL